VDARICSQTACGCLLFRVCSAGRLPSRGWTSCFLNILFGTIAKQEDRHRTVPYKRLGCTSFPRTRCPEARAATPRLETKCVGGTLCFHTTTPPYSKTSCPLLCCAGAVLHCTKSSPSHTPADGHLHHRRKIIHPFHPRATPTKAIPATWTQPSSTPPSPPIIPSSFLGGGRRRPLFILPARALSPISPMAFIT
jgi:hypothetical protein